MLSEEEIRTIVENLSLREIIEPALDNWQRYESTGKTVINIESGKVKGIAIRFNEIPEFDFSTNHIELYKIESDEELFDEENLLDDEEYEKYLDFREEKLKNEIYDEYNPQIFYEFCKMESIDEKERKIRILIENYEDYQFNHYQDFEHEIILYYHDEEEKF